MQSEAGREATKIKWASRKLYKPGKISTQENEAERQRGFNEKPHCRPCVCVHFSNLRLSPT